MIEDYTQLSLFSDEDIPQPPRPKARKGGSNNSIVFHDYESFIAKFGDNPKTTDDCYTPQDVYEAVVQYVGTVIDMTDKVILRPFFPGGDYEHSDYPENGVVIDNPPFSIFTKCCAFYASHKIPFFLFGPGLTITSCCKYCTAVVVSDHVTFENGAVVKCNFASNLYGDMLAVTAPLLSELISSCPSQNKKANLPKFRYPDEVLSVSDLQTICRGGIDFKVRRDEGIIIRNLAHHPSANGLFGDHILLSATQGADKEAARLRAQEAARLRAQEAARLRAQEAARLATPVKLSPHEQRIVDKLEQTYQENRITSSNT